MSNNRKDKENSSVNKTQTSRKEKIHSSFEKAIKANGNALKKLSKD